MLASKEYLRDIFAEQYIAGGGLDDEMPDAESDWFGNLDPEDVIELAEKWRKQI